MEREPGVVKLLSLLDEVVAGDELERELDELESYFSVQLERLEDMDPGQVPEEKRTLLMQAIEVLLGVVERIREGDRELRPEILAAEEDIRRAQAR